MSENEYCSFCGRDVANLRKVIEGNGVYICEDCVLTCGKLMVERANSKIKGLKPKKIYNELNKYIIGQDEAKKILSVAIYNHYKRINHNQKNFEKSNILLVGASGSGKTLLAETLAQIIDVPLVICDATSLTEAGYVGEDVENILLRLIQKANYDIKRAENGIIYLDEFDKLAKKSENMSITRDVSGEGVQQALLKIIEGIVANVPPQGGRKHPYQEYLKINTKNILFICGGAFTGIEEIAHARANQHRIGFIDNQSMNNTSLQHDDFKNYGLIPEIIGRLPIIAQVNPLKIEDLKRILIEPKNAIIKQYCDIMRIDGVEIQFTDDAISTIAALAHKEEKGARGLRSIIERIMLDIMFEIPKKSVIISKDYIVQKLDCKLDDNLQIS